MKTIRQARASSRTSAAERVQHALRAAEKPQTSAQIAAATGLTRPAVRHHLRQMRDDGTAVSLAARCADNARGRPAAAWVARAIPEPALLARLARELAIALDSAAEPGQVRGRLRRLGADIAASASTACGDLPIVESLDRLGFSPRIVEQTDTATCIELRSCPFVEPAQGLRDTSICAVHAQLVAGMAPADTMVDRLEASRTGFGCRVHLLATSQRRPRTRLTMLGES